MLQKARVPGKYFTMPCNLSNLAGARVSGSTAAAWYIRMVAYMPRQTLRNARSSRAPVFGWNDPSWKTRGIPTVFILFCDHPKQKPESSIFIWLLFRMIAIKINTVGIPRVFQEGSFHPKTGARDALCGRAFRRVCSVLIFILVLVTHVHTTDIQCMQTLVRPPIGAATNSW